MPYSPLQPRGDPELPRVLYILTMSPCRKYGSLEEQIVLLANAFSQARQGRFVPLFNCPAEEADTRQFTSRGIPAECLDLRTFHSSILWRLLTLTRQYGIQLVHWNFLHPLKNAYLWGLTLLAPWLRHWYTDHISRTGALPSPQAGWRAWLKRKLLQRYERVLCVSDYVREYLARTDTWSNLITVPHFINTDRFVGDEERRQSLRQARGVSQKLVLLVIGQLIRDKGIDVAIRALARLPDRVVLWVVGDGPEREALGHLACEAGVATRVEFVGLQPDVRPFLQAADVFICPSRWAEAAGLVNLEAQACGLPVLASRIGGIPEYLAEDRSGWLFPVGDVNALVALITRLEANPILCRQMGQAARALALERFSPEVRLPQLLSLYRKG